MGVDSTSTIGVRLFKKQVDDKSVDEPETKKLKTDVSESSEEDLDDCVWEGEVSKTEWNMTSFKGDEVVIFSTIDQRNWDPKIDVEALELFLADFKEIIKNGEGELINFVKVE